ncbi:MAG: hypothetical protein QE279_03520 [Rhodoferax sp.]|nr:hypothetical protein [Rhodoferax sp.]
MSNDALRLVSTLKVLEETKKYMRGQPSLAVDGLMERARSEASYLIGLM